MPTAPRYIAKLTPEAGAIPEVRVNATPEAFGAPIARGIEHLGAAFEQVSNDLADHALKMQAQDNAAEADALTTQYMSRVNEDTYGENGYYLKKEGAAVADFPAMKDKLIKSREEIGGGATSQAVRKLYDSATRPQMIYNLGNISGHYASERNKYNETLFNGKRDTLIQSAALNYNNPEQRDGTIDQLRQSWADYGLSHGMDLQAVFPKYMADVQKVYAMGIQAKALHDQRGAQDDLDKYRDMVGEENYIRISKALEGPLQAEDARAQVIATLTGIDPKAVASPVAPFSNSTDAARQIAKQIPGAVITSFGPATSAAGKAARVENTYHNLPNGGQAVDFAVPGQTPEQTAKLAGNIWGNIPGVKIIPEHKGDKNSTGDHVHIQWEKSKGAVPAALGATSVDMRANQQQYIDNARAAALEARPGDYVYADKVENLMRQEMNQRVQAQQYAEASSVDYISGALKDNMEEGKAPTLDQYMKDPEFAKAYQALPEAKQLSLGKAITRTSQAPRPPTEAQERRFNQLYGMAYNPQKQQAFIGVDLFAEDIPPQYRHQLSNMQARIAARQPAAMKPVLKATLNDPMVVRGLHQAGIDNNSDEHDAYVGALNSEIDAYIAVYNTNPDLNTRQKMARNLLLHPSGKTDGIGAGPQYYQANPALIVKGVPDKDVGSIADRLRHSGLPVTMDNIQDLYKIDQQQKAK